MREAFLAHLYTYIVVMGKRSLTTYIPRMLKIAASPACTATERRACAHRRMCNLITTALGGLSKVLVEKLRH